MDLITVSGNPFNLDHAGGYFKDYFQIQPVYSGHLYQIAGLVSILPVLIFQDQNNFPELVEESGVR